MLTATRLVSYGPDDADETFDDEEDRLSEKSDIEIKNFVQVHGYVAWYFNQVVWFHSYTFGDSSPSLIMQL